MHPRSLNVHFDASHPSAASDEVPSGVAKGKPSTQGTAAATSTETVAEAVALDAATSSSSACKDYHDPARLREELRNAHAEIERLKSQLAVAPALQLKQPESSLVADCEQSTSASSRDSGASGRRRHSIDTMCRPDLTDDLDSEEDQAYEPKPPDGSVSWDWPLSRQEKKARVQLLERALHAIDRKTLIKELRHVGSCSDSDSEGCSV